MSWRFFSRRTPRLTPAAQPSALRRYGLFAAIAALVGGGLTFAGAYTAGEPLWRVVIATLIVAVGAFLMALVVLAAGSRVVRGNGKQKPKTGDDRAE